ncbi:MAG TPA: hypothetical protein VLU25_03755 [Acidobacteriota bacterium]|nr:hypothetical protein [Acidobacteriota bacterium]
MGGFRYFALLVDPELNTACELDYDTTRWAIVRLGFQPALGGTTPEFSDVDRQAFLEGIEAKRFSEPGTTLPGKKKGILKAATVGPNVVEIYFPIPPGFWERRRKVKLEASINGLSFSKKLRIR